VPDGPPVIKALAGSCDSVRSAVPATRRAEAILKTKRHVAPLAARSIRRDSRRLTPDGLRRVHIGYTAGRKVLIVSRRNQR
jgi:hypothetical protein